MADIEHSAITDPNIHEPKGASTAVADTVYVADGAGSGDWTALADFITDSWTMNDLINVRYESNTPESITAETWTQRGLNQTKTNNLASASLSSNRISLPAGTYYIDASVPVAVENQDSASGSFIHKTKLYNVTGTADLIVGTVDIATGNSDSDGIGIASFTLRSRIKGVFTLASTSSVEIRSWVSDTCSSYGAELNTEGLVVSVSTEAVIWRIA